MWRRSHHDNAICLALSSRASDRRRASYQAGSARVQSAAQTAQRLPWNGRCCSAASSIAHTCLNGKSHERITYADNVKGGHGGGRGRDSPCDVLSILSHAASLASTKNSGQGRPDQSDHHSLNVWKLCCAGCLWNLPTFACSGPLQPLWFGCFPVLLGVLLVVRREVQWGASVELGSSGWNSRLGHGVPADVAVRRP